MSTFLNPDHSLEQDSCSIEMHLFPLEKSIHICPLLMYAQTHNICCVWRHIYAQTYSLHPLWNSRGLLSTLWGEKKEMTSLEPWNRQKGYRQSEKQTSTCVCVRTCICVFRPHVVTWDFMRCTDLFGQCDKPSDNQLSSSVHTWLQQTCACFTWAHTFNTVLFVLVKTFYFKLIAVYLARSFVKEPK